MSLERALALLDGDPAAALKALILAWQERRAPEIAALVDQLDARYAKTRPPITQSRSVIDDAYERIARKRDLTDVGRILGAPPHANDYRDRTVRFGLVPRFAGADDPRLGTALVALLSRKLIAHHEVRSVLRTLSDPRTLEPLRAAMVRAPAWVVKPLTDVARRIEKATPPPLSSDDKALIKKLAGAIRAMPAPQADSPARGVAAKVKVKVKTRATTGSKATATAETPTGATASVAKGAKKVASSTSARAARPVDLAAALALVDGDPARALAPLLDAWRRARHPSLAALIEATGARVDRQALPTRPATKAMPAWMACEYNADAADIDRLVAGLRVGVVRQIIERLDMLARRPEDPRLGAAGLALFEDQPFTSVRAQPIYGAAERLVEAMRDPRSVLRLEHLLAHRMPGKGPDGGVSFASFFAAKVERLLATAREFPGAGASDALDASTVARIEARLPTTHVDEEAALTAAIWAAPDDDEPRQVYADWLQERGRPHGELIALQLARHLGRGTPEALRRERSLLAARNVREFLGPLAPAVTLTGLKFERGLVVYCQLSDKRSPLIDDVAEHPAWVTVRTFYAWTPARKLHKKLIAHLKKLGARSVRA